MKKRLTALLLVLALLSGIFAGCSEKAAEEKETAASAGNTDAPSGAASAETEAETALTDGLPDSQYKCWKEHIVCFCMVFSEEKRCDQDSLLFIKEQLCAIHVLFAASVACKACIPAARIDRIPVCCFIIPVAAEHLCPFGIGGGFAREPDLLFLQVLCIAADQIFCEDPPRQTVGCNMMYTDKQMLPSVTLNQQAFQNRSVENIH